MLGSIPIIRRSAGTVIGSHLWNLILAIPFAIAYWVITETHDRPERNCYLIPWDVAIFARWAFIGFCAYQICSIPLNCIAMKKRRREKQWVEEHMRREDIHQDRVQANNGQVQMSHQRVEVSHIPKIDNRHRRLLNWMRMFDALYWLANWALWYYIITAVVHRAACPDGNVMGLHWATMIISAALALIGLIVLAVVLAKFLVKLMKEMEEEAKARAAVDHLPHREHAGDRFKEGAAMGQRVGDPQYVVREDRYIGAQGGERPGAIRQLASRVLDKGEHAVERDGQYAEKKPVAENRRFEEDRGRVGENRGRHEEIVNIREDVRDVRDVREVRDDRRYYGNEPMNTQAQAYRPYHQN